MAEESRLDELLGSLMNDGELMDQLRAAAAQMGLDGMLGSAPAGESGSGAAPQEPAPAPMDAPPKENVPPELSSAFGRVMPLLAEYGRQDENTRLLEALRPFLSGERERRLGDAQRMLAVMRVAEKLRGS